MHYLSKPRSLFYRESKNFIWVHHDNTRYVVQINRSNELGVLKQGFPADIIAVDNDLDKNINAILQVHFIMKDGKVYVNKH